MHRRHLLGLGALLALGGCARKPAPAGEDLAVQPAALAFWRDFPVDARPRPVVLLDGRVLEPHWASAEAEQSATDNGFSLDLPLAAPPPTVSLPRPDGTLVVPLLSGADACSLLPKPAADPSGPPVAILAAELKSAPFRTDRGEVALPAWLFTVPEADAPVTVLALDPAAYRAWPDSTTSRTTRVVTATLSADGMTVSLRPPVVFDCGWTQWIYTPVVVETPSAVAVGWIAGRPAGCDDAPVPQPVTLAAPLGGRVLIHYDGQPIATVAG